MGKKKTTPKDGYTPYVTDPEPLPGQPFNLLDRIMPKYDGFLPRTGVGTVVQRGLAHSIGDRDVSVILVDWDGEQLWPNNVWIAAEAFKRFEEKVSYAYDEPTVAPMSDAFAERHLGATPDEVGDRVPLDSFFTEEMLEKAKAVPDKSTNPEPTASVDEWHPHIGDRVEEIDEGNRALNGVGVVVDYTVIGSENIDNRVSVGFRLSQPGRIARTDRRIIPQSSLRPAAPLPSTPTKLPRTTGNVRVTVETDDGVFSQEYDPAKIFPGAIGKQVDACVESVLNPHRINSAHALVRVDPQAVNR